MNTTEITTGNSVVKLEIFYILNYLCFILATEVCTKVGPKEAEAVYLKSCHFAIAQKVLLFIFVWKIIAKFFNKAKSGHTGLENLDVPLYIRPAAVKAFATLCNIR